MASNQTLILRSSDGEEFAVSRRAAVLSRSINDLCVDGRANSEIPLPNVDGKTLSKIVDYIDRQADSSLSGKEPEEFDDKFLADEPLPFLLDILRAAQYLTIRPLTATAVLRIGAVCKNRDDPSS